MLTDGAAVLDRFISMVSQQGRDFGERMGDRPECPLLAQSGHP